MDLLRQELSDVTIKIRKHKQKQLKQQIGFFLITFFYSFFLVLGMDAEVLVDNWDVNRRMPHTVEEHNEEFALRQFSLIFLSFTLLIVGMFVDYVNPKWYLVVLLLFGGSFKLICGQTISQETGEYIARANFVL